MLAWLTFGSTVLLVGITAWYAVLTRSLAVSARESARSAQAAAEYAAQSVAATVAGVKVKFHATPSYSIGGRDAMFLGVTLVCTGATVFVHEARILEASRSTSYGKGHEEFEATLIDPVGHPMTTEVDLPVRMHDGETVSFEADPEILLEKDVSIAILRVRVRYSLDGIGDGILREMEWHGTRGVDYETRR